MTNKPNRVSPYKKYQDPVTGESLYKPRDAGDDLLPVERVAAAARVVYPEFANLGEITTERIVQYIRDQFIQIDQEIRT